MTYYGAKEIAASFRTVRGNTIKIAEEIPEDKYSFKASPESRSIGQTLTHISTLHRFQFAINKEDKRSSMEGFNFGAFIGPIRAEEQKAQSKAEILQRLKTTGDEYASWVETLSDEFLAEVVTMPPGGNPPSRTRFDMIISVKEHEMHHRGQLMMIERMIGITPHLTREQEARMAAMQGAK